MPARIQCTDRGIAVELDSGQSASLQWHDVCEIVTYKRDLFSYDQICLAFRTAVDNEWTEIWESDEGFEEACRVVRERFPSVPEDWYSTVMLPPFETCRRVLYQRL